MEVLWLLQVWRFPNNRSKPPWPNRSAPLPQPMQQVAKPGYKRGTERFFWSEVSSQSRGFSQTHTFHLKQPFFSCDELQVPFLPTLGLVGKMLSFPNIHTFSSTSSPSVPDSQQLHVDILAPFDRPGWCNGFHGFHHISSTNIPQKRYQKNGSNLWHKYPKFQQRAFGGVNLATPASTASELQPAPGLKRL